MCEDDSPPSDPIGFVSEGEAEELRDEMRKLRGDIAALILRLEDEDTELDAEMWMELTEELKRIIGADPRKLMRDQCEAPKSS